MSKKPARKPRAKKPAPVKPAPEKAPELKVEYGAPYQPIAEMQSNIGRFSYCIIRKREKDLACHRLTDTVVRQYILNHLDQHPGCQQNVCSMAVSDSLREDFSGDGLVIALDSLEWQLPILHMLRGGSSV